MSVCVCVDFVWSVICYYSPTVFHSARYHTTEFIDKNRDKLYQEGVALLNSSTSKFVKVSPSRLERLFFGRG